ncbi:spore germination protein [Lentibacillus cibarius]|uniref:Spore germination protein n=1 Tax=Lentibacillus cibarius TaxID=2583219 RepID=A0A549YIN4_9BACI|nr:spore germination protein [Lentibacillus cibarius]TRM11745.1 spore germination protein [Lentibacillus cibarius]
MKFSNVFGKVIKRSLKSEQDATSDVEWNPFSTNLRENEKLLQEQMGDSADIMFTKFTMQMKNNDTDTDALLVVVDGLVNEETKRNNILKPLQEHPISIEPNEHLDQVQNRLSIKHIAVEKNVNKAVFNILNSKGLLIIDGVDQGLILDMEGFETRTIAEPSNEKTVRGSHEGFIETTSTNMSMLRRRISHPALQFEQKKIGKFTRTNVTIAYMKHITDPELLQRVRDRLDQIEVDNIDSSGNVEQFIEDHPYSIFPTIGNTERPDLAASLLMEGKIVIMVDGDPVSLYVPLLFVESVKNIEDYESRPFYASFLRLLRAFAFIVSVTFPAVYVSALNFNKAMIPTDLIVPLFQARETVPFPLAMEVFFMILMFEVVREAGVRLPETIGSALSIVGALILGEVSVSAGLVGAPTIVIVSLSYIASFMITPIADVTALLRLGFVISSSIFGMYGIIVLWLGILTHMVSLTSLGVPHMAPFAPFYFRDWKDAIIRVPLRWIKYRQKSVPHQQSRRIKSLPKTGGKQ